MVQRSPCNHQETTNKQAQKGKASNGNSELHSPYITPVTPLRSAKTVTKGQKNVVRKQRSKQAEGRNAPPEINRTKQTNTAEVPSIRNGKKAKEGANKSTKRVNNSNATKVPPSRSGKKTLEAGREEDVYDGDICTMEEQEQTNKPKGQTPQSAKVPSSRSGKRASIEVREEGVYEGNDFTTEETTEQRNKPKGRMPRNDKVPPSRIGKKN